MFSSLHRAQFSCLILMLLFYKIFFRVFCCGVTYVHTFFASDSAYLLAIGTSYLHTCNSCSILCILQAMQKNKLINTYLLLFAISEKSRVCVSRQLHMHNVQVQNYVLSHVIFVLMRNQIGTKLNLQKVSIFFDILDFLEDLKILTL